MADQHPEVYVPEKKELHFFNTTHNYEKELKWYRQQFNLNNQETAKVAGEAVPNYLWTSATLQDMDESNRLKNIPLKVYRHYPNIKLIAILRNPVDPAISAFFHQIRDRNIPPSSDILDVGNRYGIFSMGYYDRDLSQWFKYFPSEQFRIFNPG